MARTRRIISIDEKISKTQKAVAGCKEKYAESVPALAALQEKKAAMQKKELIVALENSGRSYDESMAFPASSQEE